MSKVLSIPAGKTFQIIEDHLVHAFPNTQKYKLESYVTFRKQHSIMTDLYTVENAVVFDPNHDEIDYVTKDVGKEEKERITAYVKDRKMSKMGFDKPDTPYVFWLLKWELSLPHEPRPEKGNPTHVYYNYEELVNGDRFVTSASSRKNGLTSKE
ncbi:hypothetical protein QA612_01510 [Evansella sp. AB-P1]|uniref:hypothetical protein n=1 Tax=Evansella sp. AB-P1 TaxID=3037653 RepID=UPI00241C511E|nr:hypothetical protein [Evansella sp. AB-P1]MDG5786150.1 hypothetical protein [Evansella sp. AB-P1]